MIDHHHSKWSPLRRLHGGQKQRSFSIHNPARLRLITCHIWTADVQRFYVTILRFNVVFKMTFLWEKRRQSSGKYWELQRQAFSRKHQIQQCSVLFFFVSRLACKTIITHFQAFGYVLTIRNHADNSCEILFRSSRHLVLCTLGVRLEYNNVYKLNWLSRYLLRWEISCCGGHLGRHLEYFKLPKSGNVTSTWSLAHTPNR